MTEDRLEFGADPNLLVLKVSESDIKPVAEIRSGCVRAGFLITLHQYNLENLLCQLIEDYGEEKLIQKIKQL